MALVAVSFELPVALALSPEYKNTSEFRIHSAGHVLRIFNAKMHATLYNAD